MEREMVPAAGYPFSTVRIRGFTRRLGVSTLRTLGSFPLAALDSWRLLRGFRPDCVVGVGAYASGPVVAEAAVLGIGTVAVEMDAHMGWTNRILSRLVDRVCLSFPDARRDSQKFVHTGRPLRPALLAATREQGIEHFGLDARRPVVLIVGGSLGAHSLNEAALGAFGEGETAFQVIHVIGTREFSSVVSRINPDRKNSYYHPYAFLEDFPLALAAADLVVSRAGGSVAEILARGVPSLLVPFPLAAGNHQTKNAAEVAAAGAARMVDDADMNPQRLVEEVQILLDPEVNQSMRDAALGLARPDAATRVAEVIVELIGSRARKSI